MRIILPFGFWILLCSAVPAQTSLVGKITYFSSGAKPAVGVSVSARGANAQTSNNTGEFELYFPNKQKGDKVHITIGDQDRYGAKLELVNDKALEQLHLPSRPDDDILEIVVCKAGQRREAALAYNNLMSETAQQTFTKKLEEINRKLDTQGLDRQKIQELEEQKKVLQDQMKQLEEKMAEQAGFIADINTDHASEMVAQTIVQLHRGAEIREAVQLIDNSALETATRKAFEQEKNAQKRIDQIVEALELKIVLLEPLFDVKGIMECCTMLENIYQQANYSLAPEARCNAWAVLYPKTRYQSPRDRLRETNGPDKFKPYRYEEELVGKVYAAATLEKLPAASPLTIGDVCPDFSLYGPDNNAYFTLYEDYTGENGVIIAFIGQHDPYSQLYEQRIINLHKKYAPEGFPVLAVNAHAEALIPEESVAEMEKRAKEKRYPFSYVKDDKQQLMELLGVRRTPQIFILDKDHVIRYSGAIDDNPEAPDMVRNRYVEDAIAALLNGDIPEQQNTRVIGVLLRKAPPKGKE